MISGIVAQFCDALLGAIPFEPIANVISDVCGQIITLLQGFGL